MKHLKVAEWIAFANSPIVEEVARLPDAVKTAELRDVAQAFAKNCQRLFRLAQFPAALFEAGKREQLTTAVQHVESTRAASVPDLSGQVHSSMAGRPSAPTTVRARPYLPPNVTKVEAALEGLGDEASKDAVELLLSMQVIGAWTAFEVLAEDLWVACLNSRPRLGLVAINAEPDPGDDEKTVEKKRNQKFQIPAWLMLEEGFDLNMGMGKLLREKWDFSKRGQPADAYANVFRDKTADVKPIFEDVGLRWLAQVRNVLVHNAGNADVEFERLVQGHPILKDVKPGKPVPLDGPLVNELVGAAVRQSTALIRFVDKWLSDNPK